MEELEEDRMRDFKPFSEDSSCSCSISETVNGSHQFMIKGVLSCKGDVCWEAHSERYF